MCSKFALVTLSNLNYREMIKITLSMSDFEYKIKYHHRMLFRNLYYLRFLIKMEELYLLTYKKISLY